MSYFGALIFRVENLALLVGLEGFKAYSMKCYSSSCSSLDVVLFSTPQAGGAPFFLVMTFDDPLHSVATLRTSPNNLVYRVQGVRT